MWPVLKSISPNLSKAARRRKSGQWIEFFSVLLAVAGQHLLTSIADLLAIALQAAEDGKNIVLAVLTQELFAVPDHVRVASRALLIRALAQAVLHRRRLRRQLRKRNRSCGQHQSDRQDACTKHTWLSPRGIRPGIIA